MGNFTTVVDKNVGDVFSQSMWAIYIEQNLNKGVMRPLADSILGSAAASIDFTSIDQNFSALRLVLQGRGDTGSVPSVVLRYNGDTATNYDLQTIAEQATVATSAESFGLTSAQIGNVAGVSDVASATGICVVEIPNYTGTTFHKAHKAISSVKKLTSTGGIIDSTWSGHWRSTAAINRITILIGSGNFIAGTRATLYGLPF